jgi:hypothetical protein
MDKQHIRNELKKWFSEDFIIDQIIRHIEEYEKYSKPRNVPERNNLLKEVEVLTGKLNKALGRLKRLHESSYNRIDRDAGLFRKLKKMGNIDAIDICDFLRSIEVGAHFTNESNRESPQANMVTVHAERSPEADIDTLRKKEPYYYRTLRHKKHYRLFTELQIIWAANKSPVTLYDESEFMRFLSLCSTGNINNTESTRKAYSRIFEKADHWGQTKS